MNLFDPIWNRDWRFYRHNVEICVPKPGFFFDPEKKLIFHPEPGPDLKFSPDPEFRVRVVFVAGPAENPAWPGKTRKYRNPETRAESTRPRKTRPFAEPWIRLPLSSAVPGSLLKFHQLSDDEFSEEKI